MESEHDRKNRISFEFDLGTLTITLPELGSGEEIEYVIRNALFKAINDYKKDFFRQDIRSREAERLVAKVSHRYPELCNDEEIRDFLSNRGWL